MPIPVPTRTAGSLGTTKSNAQPLTNEPQQLSAPQYNVCADNLIAAINLANANEAAIAGAGGGLANYGTYLYDASATSGAGIAAGDMRFSGANPSTSGLMYIHKTNVQGFDLTGVLDQVRSWRVSFISTDGTEMLTVFVSNVFDGGTHYIFQLTQQAGSAAFTDNAAFTVSSIAPAAFEIPQGGTYALGNWFWTGSTVVADPGAGNINMSSSSPGSAIALYVNVANASSGVDFIEPFQDLQVGDFILLRADNDAYGVRYVIDAPPIDNGTWFNIPVAVQSQGGSIGSSATMRMGIIKSSVAAAATDVLWEWNGQDVSQIGAPVVVSSNNPGTFTGVASATPVLTSPQVPAGNQLRLTGAGVGVSGTHFVAFPILANLPTNFQVDINNGSISPSGINEGFGFMIWGDPTVNFGYFWHPASRKARLDNGTLVLGSIAGTTIASASKQNLRIEGGTRADWTHGTVLYNEIPRAVTSTILSSQTLRNSFDAADGDWVLPTVPPASWAGQLANTFALCLVSTGGGGGIPTWGINSIKIRKL